MLSHYYYFSYKQEKSLNGNFTKEKKIYEHRHILYAIIHVYVCLYTSIYISV